MVHHYCYRGKTMDRDYLACTGHVPVSGMVYVMEWDRVTCEECLKWAPRPQAVEVVRHPVAVSPTDREVLDALVTLTLPSDAARRDAARAVVTARHEKLVPPKSEPPPVTPVHLNKAEVIGVQTACGTPYSVTEFYTTKLDETTCPKCLIAETGDPRLKPQPVPTEPDYYWWRPLPHVAWSLIRRLAESTGPSMWVAMDKRNGFLMEKNLHGGEFRRVEPPKE